MKFTTTFLLTFMSISTSIFANAQKGFLTDIQVFDTHSGSNNSTDPSHWFLIQGQVFVPQDAKNSIPFTVPDEFDSFPSGDFPLSYNSKIIGSINKADDSNNFDIQLVDSNILQNVSTTFNFLCKLSSKGLSEIRSPGSVSYTFTNGDNVEFVRNINYLATDPTKINTNGGIYQTNNTAWFTLDIPISQFKRPIRIQSTPSVPNAYQFDASKTTFKVVTKLNKFNQPLATVPLTAVHDYSTNSKIDVLFNSSFSGGEYVRITYYSSQLYSKTISNNLNISYPANDLSKRDVVDPSEININTNLYAAPLDNLSHINVSTPNPDVSKNSTMTPLPAYTNGTASNVTKSLEVIPTYSLDHSTVSAIVSEYGVWIPVSTLNGTTSSKMMIQSKIVRNDTTTSTPTATPTPRPDEFTNSTSSSSSIMYHNSTITTISSSQTDYSSAATSSSISSSTSKFTNTTTTQSLKQTVTKTVCPTCEKADNETQLSTIASVYQSTISEQLSEYEFLEAASTIQSTKQTSSTKASTSSKVKSTELSVSEQVYYSTKPASKSVYGDLEAVSTLSSKSSNSVAHSVEVSASKSLSTKSAVVTDIGVLEPVSTLKSSSSPKPTNNIVSGKVETTSTAPAIISLYTSVQASTLSTVHPGNTTTSHVVSIYQGGSSSLTIQFSTIIIGFIALLL
ncbi:hypothetical protein J7297_00785 [Nakaseomyces glabratus]|nr:hypothetical protein J7297_00785 [Nakaseomyces glabratus]KAH7596612.1 hypothetical protein J7296_00782 [Nakaseomyces glabratus]